MKVLYALLLFVFATSGFAEALMPSAQEILNRMEASFEKIEDYVVTLEGTIKMVGVNVPKTEAILFYKKPNKIHIESKGILFLPKKVMVINPYYLNRYFKPLSIEKKIVKEVTIYKITLIPKEKRLRNGIEIWVEDKHWSIKKMKITRFKGSTVMAHIEYTMIKGKYWLPKSTVVELNIPAKARRPEIFDDFGEIDHWEEKGTVKTKKGIVNILFKNYRGVNAGLSDEVFKRK
jgi:outer membrane lipoprotein-sorting protein